MSPRKSNTKSKSTPTLLDNLKFKDALMEHVNAQGGVSKVDAHSLTQGIMKQVLETLLQAEMDEHLGYQKHDPDGNGTGNSRNGITRKKLRTDNAEFELETPRDREGSFEPQIVKKRQTSLGHFSDKIVSLYARGMTTREIQAHLEEIYQVEISAQFVSRATEKLQEQATEWQNRPLEAFYPVVFVDGLRVPIRTSKGVIKKCVYVVLGIPMSGKQEVLGLWIEDTEGARFWMKVFHDIQSRGVEDIFILCGDGLSGLPQAALSVFPQVDMQLCVVHHIRAVCKFVSYKDRKAFCADMKPIYTAPTIEAAKLALEKFAEKWESKYPMSVISWREKWEMLTAFFKYPVQLRRVIYTTNAIEGLNAQLRKNTANRKVFPNDEAVFKLLYLNIINFTQKWTKRQYWDTVMNQLIVMEPERFKPFIEQQIH